LLAEQALVQACASRQFTFDDSLTKTIRNRLVKATALNEGLPG